MTLAKTPGSLSTRIVKICLLISEPTWLSQNWMRVKLLFVLFLLIYHFFCYQIMGKLAQGTFSWTGGQLRALNELPTLFLVIVVLLVVFKNQFPTSAATLLIVGLVLFMAISIQFYARFRRKRAESLASSSQG